jgi:hypothetical protein
MSSQLRRFFALSACVLCAAAQTRPAPDRITDPKRLISLAFEAMGGEAKVKAVKTLRIEWVGHTLQPEQSERPEGPWLTTYHTATADVDLENVRIRLAVTSKALLSPKGREMTIICAGGAGAIQLPEGQSPASPALVLDVMEPVQYSPTRVMQVAAAAADLRFVEETKYQGVPHQVVAYKGEKGDVRILLNANTHLPTAVDWVTSRPSDVFWSAWGDIKSRAIYGTWTLEGGLLLPRQVDMQRNGQPYSSRTDTVVTVNPALDPKIFMIDDNARRASLAYSTQTVEDIPLGLANQPAIPLSSTVIYVPGRWSVVLVRQSDGVVVIEGPISNGYSRKIMEEVNWRFRGTPIKALVSTCDSFPHVGGLREYIAAEIPIYGLDLNRPLLEKLASAPRTAPPDRLAQQPKQPQWNWVSSRTTLGSGPNRLELIPARGESSERVLIVYFPDTGWVYSSDLVNRNPDGSFFLPAYLGELIDTVKREKLTVDTVFGMHLRPTPYRDLVSAYYRAAGIPAPPEPAPSKPAVARPAAPPKMAAQPKPVNQ